MQPSRLKNLGRAAGLLVLTGGAQAALVDAGNGPINDTVLDITWAADASMSGAQSWDDLVQWAEDLVYGGYDDWRLASMSVAAGTPTGSTDSIIDCQTDTEANCRDNELGYMYTYYLPGSDGDDKTGDQTVGSVTLNRYPERVLVRYGGRAESGQRVAPRHRQWRPVRRQ